MNTIIDIIKNTVKSHNLLCRGDGVVIALSGGADSVCLAHALSCLAEEYELKLCAAHVNHMLRKEADSDMRFAEEFCGKLGIPIFVKSVKADEYASENKISEEEAGRRIRYDFFDEVAERTGASKIATAHNNNDSAETILMNFMRGSGLSGLCGIPYRRGRIIRPVLDLTREQTERYCRENGIGYVTDKTNFEPIYTRNKVRLELIPFITDNFNSTFINRITSNAKILSDENDFLNEYSKKVYESCVSRERDTVTIGTETVFGEHIAVRKRVIMLALKEAAGAVNSYSSKYIDSIIELAEKNVTGKRIDIPGGIVAGTEYGKLYFSKKTVKRSFERTKLCVGVNKIGNMSFTVCECDAAGKSSGNTVYIKSELADRIYVRPRKNGDYFFPVGMEGRKKIKDYFIGLKIPSAERNGVPILSTDTDDIVWVAGRRADRRFAAAEHEKSIKITFGGG